MTIISTPENASGRNWVGRPRRGTAQLRHDALLAAATGVFLKHGYGSASIDKVACEAGVSTRTIYQRFKNKADLMVAVTTRLVDRDLCALVAAADLDRMDVKEALLMIGRQLTARVSAADNAALFRILATEAIRFPELAEKMRATTKARVDDVIERYLRLQIGRGVLHLDDPTQAASLFTQMICAELHERFLFGWPANPKDIDFTLHVGFVVDLFLNGALLRETIE